MVIASRRCSATFMMNVGLDMPVGTGSPVPIDMLRAASTFGIASTQFLKPIWMRSKRSGDKRTTCAGVT